MICYEYIHLFIIIKIFSYKCIMFRHIFQDFCFRGYCTSVTEARVRPQSLCLSERRDSKKCNLGREAALDRGRWPGHYSDSRFPEVSFEAYRLITWNEEDSLAKPGTWQAEEWLVFVTVMKCCASSHSCQTVFRQLLHSIQLTEHHSGRPTSNSGNYYCRRRYHNTCDAKN